MAEVKIRDLNDHLVAFYRQRAVHRGVSLEEELRQTLSEVQRENLQRILSDIDEHREAMFAKYGLLSDSTPGIRAERDGEPDA